MKNKRLEERQQLIVNSKLDELLEKYWKLRDSNLAYTEGDVIEDLPVEYIFQKLHRLWKKFATTWNNNNKHVIKCSYTDFRERVDKFLKKEKYLVWKDYTKNFVIEYYDYPEYVDDCPGNIMKLLYSKSYTATDAAIQIAIWPRIYPLHIDKWPELNGSIKFSPSTPLNQKSNS